MRALVLVAGAALAVLPIGCTTVDPARPSSSAVVVADVERKGIEGLTDAANVYRGVANATELLVRGGFFNREQLLIIQRVNNRAMQLIFVANTGLTVEQRITELNGLRVQLLDLIGVKSNGSH